MLSKRSISAVVVACRRAAMQALLGSGIILGLIALASPQTGSSNVPENLSIPFEYASDRAALLVHVSINGKQVLLLLDTGSAHTVLRPEVVGDRRSELRPARTAQSGAAFIGDAVGREVTLHVGDHIWQKYRVAVMDLSQVLSAYQDNLDGVLGLDFLQNYRQIAIDWRQRRMTLTR